MDIAEVIYINRVKDLPSLGLMEPQERKAMFKKVAGFSLEMEEAFVEAEVDYVEGLMNEM